MSVIAEFTLFPIGKEESLSKYVVRTLAIIRDSGLDYEFGPMGTCVEGEYEEVMTLVGRCHAELRRDCERVYMAVKLDYRKGQSGRLKAKVDSVLGKTA